MLVFKTKKDLVEKLVIVIKLEGRYDIMRLIKFRQLLYTKLKEKPDVLAFECSGLEFFDSSAIGTMVQFFKTTRERRIEFVFYDLKPELTNLFQVAKLDSYFTIMTKENFKKEYLTEPCLV